ncbi:glycoside hydrolase family 3 N-terminal domain-containing protein [Rufibacter glacialis]|uniref:beta-glucosidase n=1 Tax=Rufibacter glacialis TaxID=1259555 RepID=A0A5M8QMS8_9BACT|nr:glycoside hydrolase family 3 N-terminal domain-containing protein [Rufibacter glacialis]KAA6435522.1 glycosyl hydrolase [Rufibacter glacialis]GGK64214.1 glycosyl hydrolase [Rufibacter glacialis]
MKRLTSSILLFSLTFFTSFSNPPKKEPIEKRIEDLLAKMTLEEKVGQLNFVVGDLFNTGPTVRTAPSDKFNEGIRQGKITGIFNIHGAAYIGKLQKLAVKESRLGIPLLIGADIIHGFKTIFPIPLGEAASWDLAAIENGARVAALESTAGGINLTFAPMVDISRDSRWGRTAEGAGEDPYLGSLIAAARVKGFQGKDLADPRTMAACVKHFVAYGAAEAGRDYNTTDMSEHLLREVYLPPFKAALEAGSATLMSAFNELNGVPATGNMFTMQQILRKEWGFKGAVISDWQNITEMVNHGYSKDHAQAAAQALKAGTDVDMMGEAYLNFVPQLVKSGQLEQSILDESVRRVLWLKFKLGLFDKPYQYSDTRREKNEIRSRENLAAAFDMARKSMVLLKNQGNLLPLTANVKRIAVIGPLGNNKADMNGTWSFFGEEQHAVSFLEGIRKYAKGAEVTYAQGCDLYSNSTALFTEAVAAAQKADVVIMALGESAVMNGEGASRADIGLPGNQLDLVKEIHKTGKPMVALVSSGRALELTWLDQNVPAILATWSLGSEAGNAVASVLYGEYNPAGKLPLSFPRAVGQLPLYYNYKSTGRMYEGNHSEPGSERVYKSRYRDVPNTPLYPFGYGLSYTTFSYGAPRLSKNSISGNESLTVTVEVTNTGKLTGEEVVQLYLRDLVGSTTRPVQQLKKFQKLSFAPGEKKTVTFTLTTDDLSFWRQDMTFGPEPGQFKVMVGGNSRDVQELPFTLTSI